jgi:hypothetical protein
MFPTTKVYPTEYQTVAPTRTSDRVCVAMTVCGPTGEEIVAPTEVEDRRCLCGVGFWYNGSVELEPELELLNGTADSQSGSWDGSNAAFDNTSMWSGSADSDDTDATPGIRVNATAPWTHYPYAAFHSPRFNFDQFQVRMT